MSCFRFLALSGALGFLAPGLAAQDPSRSLSLEEALRLSLPASEAVGIARAGVDRAAADLRAARSGFFPQLTGSVGYDRLIRSQFSALAGEGGGNGDPAPERCSAFTPPVGASVGDRLSALEESLHCVSRANPFSDLGSLPFGRANTWQWGLAASQTLFAGGRLRAGVRAADAVRESARLSLTMAEAQVVVETVEIYADAVLADRLLAIAQSALDQADSTLAQTALRREVGTAPEFDLLRATVARDNLRPPLIQAGARQAVARRRLREFLNLPGTPELALVTDIADTALTGVPSLRALVERAADTTAARRAPVQQAAAALDARRAQVQSARGERLPSLAISSQYGRVAYPDRGLPDWDAFYTNWNVAVGLQVPLFTGGRLQATAAAARAEAHAAELRHEQARKGAGLDAQIALATYAAALATWEASAGVVAQAQRAYDIAAVRFREGISTQTELLDARLALQQAEAISATAARDLLVARVRLALLSDLPLSGAGSLASDASLAAPVSPSTWSPER